MHVYVLCIVCELFPFSKKVLEETHKNSKSYIKVVELEAIFPCFPFTSLPLYIVLWVLLLSKHLEKNIFLQLILSRGSLWALVPPRDFSSHRALSTSFLLKVSLSQPELGFQGILCSLTSPSISCFSINISIALLSQEDHSLKSSILPLEVCFRINYRTYGNCHKHI